MSLLIAVFSCVAMECQSLAGTLWYLYYRVRYAKPLGDLMSLAGLFHPIKTAVAQAVAEVRHDETVALVKAKADAAEITTKAKADAAGAIAKAEADAVVAVAKAKAELGHASLDVKVALGKVKADALAVNPQLSEEAKILAEKFIDAAIAALASHGV